MKNQTAKNKKVIWLKEDVIKKPPVLDLEKNKLYSERIQRVKSEVLKLEEEVMNFLDGSSTKCPSTRISLNSISQEGSKHTQRSKGNLQVSTKDISQQSKFVKEVNKHKKFSNRTEIIKIHVLKPSINSETEEQTKQIFVLENILKETGELKYLENTEEFKSNE